MSRDILKLTYSQFKNSFCEYKTLTLNRGNRKKSKEWIVKYHNLDYLYSLIEPYVFECDLRLSVGKQYINIDYNLQEQEKRQHEEIIDKVLEDSWLMATPNFFLKLTQWLQNNYSRSPEKFTIVDEILKNNNPKKVLIFAKYIATQELLKYTLSQC